MTNLFILKYLPIGGCPEILGIFDDELLAHTYMYLHIRGDHTCMNDTENQYEVDEIELNRDSRFGGGWNPGFVAQNWDSCHKRAERHIRLYKEKD